MGRGNKKGSVSNRTWLVRFWASAGKTVMGWMMGDRVGGGGAVVCEVTSSVKMRIVARYFMLWRKRCMRFILIFLFCLRKTAKDEQDVDMEIKMWFETGVSD